MNWDIISAVSEFTGVIAVVISLLYVSRMTEFCWTYILCRSPTFMSSCRAKCTKVCLMSNHSTLEETVFSNFRFTAPVGPF